MGLGIVLAFYVLLSAVLFVPVWLVTRVVRQRIAPKQRLLVMALKALPFGIAIAPLTLFTGGIIWANIAPPSVIFKAVFTQAPSDRITDLQGVSDATNDGQEIYLSFRAEQNTLNALVRSGFRLLAAGDRGDWVPMPSTDAPPKWWHAEKCPVRQVLIAENIRNWDEIVVTRCSSDGHVYVQARWID